MQLHCWALVFSVWRPPHTLRPGPHTEALPGNTRYVSHKNWMPKQCSSLKNSEKRNFQFLYSTLLFYFGKFHLIAIFTEKHRLKSVKETCQRGTESIHKLQPFSDMHKLPRITWMSCMCEHKQPHFQPEFTYNIPCHLPCIVLSSTFQWETLFDMTLLRSNTSQLIKLLHTHFSPVCSFSHICWYSAYFQLLVALIQRQKVM